MLSKIYPQCNELYKCVDSNIVIVNIAKSCSRCAVHMFFEEESEKFYVVSNYNQDIFFNFGNKQRKYRFDNIILTSPVWETRLIIYVQEASTISATLNIYF